MSREDWMEPRFRPAASKGWRAYWFRVIFFHHERDERLFDVLLLGVILVSVLVALLDSVALLHAHYGKFFYALEWAFTIAFTVEYLIRLSLVTRPMRYALSFYGLIDLLATLPTYISLFVIGADHLLVIRVLRLLRVFRIFKLSAYVVEYRSLGHALRASRRKAFRQRRAAGSMRGRWWRVQTLIASSRMPQMTASVAARLHQSASGMPRRASNSRWRCGL